MLMNLSAPSGRFFSILTLSEGKYWYCDGLSAWKICHFQYPSAVRKQILIWRASRRTWVSRKSVFAITQKEDTDMTHIPTHVSETRISIWGRTRRRYWYDVHPDSHECIENQYMRLHRVKILKYRFLSLMPPANKTAELFGASRGHERLLFAPTLHPRAT